MKSLLKVAAGVDIGVTSVVERNQILEQELDDVNFEIGVLLRCVNEAKSRTRSLCLSIWDKEEELRKVHAVRLEGWAQNQKRISDLKDRMDDLMTRLEVKCTWLQQLLALSEDDLLDDFNEKGVHELKFDDYQATSIGTQNSAVKYYAF